MVKSLLYVDDESVNTLLFKINFDKEFKTYVTTSIDEAINLVKQGIIDYVVSDFKMPVMNGVQFIKIVKEHDSNIPCLILSAYDKEEIENIANGDMTIIDGYLQKPYMRDSVINKLNNIKLN